MVRLLFYDESLLSNLYHRDAIVLSNQFNTYLLARLSCLSLCLSSSLSETESDSLSDPELLSDDDDDDELLEHDELESEATPVSSFTSTESAIFAISGRCF